VRRMGESQRTKYGHKRDLRLLTANASELDINIIFDAVLNHKAGADACEPVEAVRVNPQGSIPCT
jgi:alpha-amylase